MKYDDKYAIMILRCSCIRRIASASVAGAENLFERKCKDEKTNAIPIVRAAVLIVFAAACAVFTIGCGFFQVRDADALKARVVNYVRENEAALIEHIRQKSFTELENSGIIEDIYAHDAYIDFSCGGSGFGPNTSYWGFYYVLSENVDAAVREIADGRELTETENGFEYEEDDGDNIFYIEQITGRFYYYFESY